MSNKLDWNVFSVEYQQQMGPRTGSSPDKWTFGGLKTVPMKKEVEAARLLQNRICYVDLSHTHGLVLRRFSLAALPRSGCYYF